MKSRLKLIGKIPESFYSVLSHMTEIHDDYLHGHSQHVSNLAVALGKRIGLPKAQLRFLCAGALIHDIGKLGIPDSVINKPSSLTRAEREMIERHPIMGYELISPVVHEREVLEILLHHHEKWDGTGYPDKLRDGQIPLGARIVRIADTFDAMTAQRPYRPAFTAIQALAEMQEDKSYYDARLLGEFDRMIRERNHARTTIARKGKRS